MSAFSWESEATLTALLAPLVGVPLGAITFYLRSMYEHQVSRHAELVRRFELLERNTAELARNVAALARDYTTKEEWLRECLYTRAQVERLAETLGARAGPARTAWARDGGPSQPLQP